MSNSNTPTKPDKPYDGFPLYPHRSGKWAKTIRGRTYYFGKWSDPHGALQEYLEVRDDLHAGREPTSTDAITIGDLCNEFLRHCRAKLQAGELTQVTLNDYLRITDLIVQVFKKSKPVESLRPSDFAKLRTALSQNCSAITTKNRITKVRRVFNFGVKQLELPQPRYGESLDPPRKHLIRQAKSKNGKKLFSADEIRALLENARTPELRALILLGINCGYGNSDAAKLPLEALKMESGWLDYARPKTGTERRCPLWKETISALREVLERRDQRLRLAVRKGVEPENVFLTKYGKTFENCETSITNEFAKCLRRLNLNRKGRGFYSLRHTFRTVADGTRDFPACRLIMGHSDSSIDSWYVEEIENERLESVVNHIHNWLFLD